MEETSIRKYAILMKELGLTGLEIKENGSELRLERVEGKTYAPAPAQSAPEAAAPQEDDGLMELRSPMVGVFYSAPAENARPFVAVGEHVKKGDVVCIIEAMKLMNEIVSDYDGTVAEVCVGNGQTVDYGHVLLRINGD